MQFTPQPIDVLDIKIDETLEELIEKLAKNTHNIWAAQRLADGWVFGKDRDDTKKTHPCLVKYESLPENEKEYDRKVSEGLIKTILKMGYIIQEPVKQIDRALVDQLDEITNTLQFEPLKLNQLIGLWKKHNASTWKNKPDLYLLLGQRILRSGEALTAYDIFSKGLEAFDDTVMLNNSSDSSRVMFVKMQQQRALALAQSGASKAARHILMKLYHQGADDGETLGILGRTLKDMASTETKLQRRGELLREAFENYHQAYSTALKKKNIDQAYYTGVNAASLALFIGDMQTCRTLAKEVKTLCQEKLNENEENPAHWLFATLGEAELLLGNQKGAKTYYQRAAGGASRSFRDIASMRKQASAILTETGADDTWLDESLQVPTVVAFTGHMIDLPCRAQKRFPAELETPVREQISQKLEEMHAGIAYSSAACGSDIIFLEEILKRGGEINIALPFERERFVEESVDIIPGSDWLERFEFLESQAARVQILGCHNEISDNQTNFEFTNLFIYGSAIARSQTLDAIFHALAVWDGQKEDRVGGTASAVCNWQKIPNNFASINPLRLLNEPPSKQVPTKRPDKNKKLIFKGVRHHAHLPMLFADVKGYSKLSEQQKVEFSVNFLGQIGAMIKQFEPRILSKHTQGDGIFLVVEDVGTAVQLAKTINRTSSETDWSRYNLPEHLLFRISLDAGPCYSYLDPIVGQKEFCGAYVVRAARMEPITPPGEIYASETFVAMAYATGVNDVRFDYVGQVELPKEYGVVPTFHLS
jgi:class 3 adenylate cyclase